MKVTTQDVTIVLFGATGDLATRKLFPSLYDLYCKDLLPSEFTVVGFSRRELSDEEFRVFVTDILVNDDPKPSDSNASLMSDQVGQGSNEGRKDKVKDFVSNLKYCQGDLLEKDSYSHLAKFLGEHDEKSGTCSPKLFYLSVQPSLYEPIFRNLASSELNTPCFSGVENDDMSWTRILVEKPFGSDLVQAQSLDKLLGELFQEEQIFRIDHYMGKEVLQNIISFRFSNAIFDPIWNNKYVESIHVKLNETDTIRARGAFYDANGALRDVGQNHILQMLALTTMEDPMELSDKAIRDSREKVLESLQLKEGGIIERGQYDGYLDVDGVAVDSKTETYFKVEVEIDTDRWGGVPIYIEAGKVRKEDVSEILVTFKEKPNGVCSTQGHKDGQSHQNTVRFALEPKEEISVKFWNKKPGFTYELESHNLEFSYDDKNSRPDAYQKVFLDCLNDDHTIFMTTREVEAQWRLIGDILEKFKEIPLEVYYLDED